MSIYYVSYVSLVKREDGSEEYGYGSLTTNKLDTLEDIDRLRESTKEQREELIDIVILFWNKLEG